MEKFKEAKDFYVAASLHKPEEGRVLEINRMIFSPGCGRFVSQSWRTSEVLKVSHIENDLYLVETALSVYFVMCKSRETMKRIAVSFQVPKIDGEMQVSFFVFNQSFKRFFLQQKKVFVKAFERVSNTPLCRVESNNCEEYILYTI